MIPTHAAGTLPESHGEVYRITESLVANGTPRVIAEHWAEAVRTFNVYSSAARTSARSVAHAAADLAAQLEQGYNVVDFVHSKSRDLTEALNKREIAAQSVRSAEYVIREMAKRDGLVAS